MARRVRCALVQAGDVLGPDAGLPAIKQAMIDKHVVLLADAARQGAQIVCLQELFYGPYFCAEQQTRWYHLTERVPDGPTVSLMRDLARQHGVVLVAPIYEEEQTGVYYNTAAVIDQAVGPHVIARLLADYRAFLERHADRGWTCLEDFRGRLRDRVVEQSRIRRPDQAHYHGGYVAQEGYAAPEPDADAPPAGTH